MRRIRDYHVLLADERHAELAQSSSSWIEHEDGHRTLWLKGTRLLLVGDRRVNSAAIAVAEPRGLGEPRPAGKYVSFTELTEDQVLQLVDRLRRLVAPVLAQCGVPPSEVELDDAWRELGELQYAE